MKTVFGIVLAALSLFGAAHQNTVVITSAPTAVVAAFPKASTPVATTVSKPVPALVHASATAGAVLGTSTETIYVTQDQLTAQIDQAANILRSLIYQKESSPNSLPATGGYTNEISLSNRIDNLSGSSNGPLTISNATFSDVSGLTAAEIPALNYFSATSTISIAFGGTGTSTQPTANELMLSDANGNWEYVATSSLGISGSGLSLTGTAGELAYFSGTNSAVGTSSIFISSSGNIGIGTTSPSALLTVDSNSPAGTIIRMSNASMGGHVYDFLETGSANTGGAGRLDFFDKTAGAARLSIAANGNIGVGTTSPFTTLSVTGNEYLTGNLNVGDVATTLANLGLSYASNAIITNATHIAAWGDSLTAGTSGNTPFTTPLAQMTGYTVYNGGVGGQTSSQIEFRMVAATSTYSWPTIIWSGRNDGCSISTAESNIALMVQALQSVGNNNYVILGIINGTTEGVGTGAYTCITNLDSYLASTYGSHFIDVREYLVSLYNPNLPQDVIDYGNDTPPTSLRASGDTLHLNSQGYWDVANYIYKNFSVLQPANSASTLTPSNALTLFANPPTIGSTTPGAAYFSRIAVGTTTNYSALTLDAGGSASASAITFSGLPLSTNTILQLKSGPNNLGWSIGSAGGSQDLFNIRDTYSTNVFSINTASSSNPSFYNPSSTSAPFGFGTTTANSNTASRVAISAGAYNSGSSPLLNFVDLPSSPPPIIGVRTATGNAGWTITASGGSDEFFNLTNAGVTTVSVYTSSGNFNSYWNPQNVSSKFGFGTTTPWAKLAIAGTAGGTMPLFVIGTSTSAYATSTALIVDNNGRLGVGTSTPWRTLSVNGPVGFAGLTSDTADSKVLCLTANNEVVANAGTSCITSSQRFKNTIVPLDEDSGLSEVLQLNPVSFQYNADIGIPGTQVGFIAEQVQQIDPRLVVLDDSGLPFTVRYENLTAILAKAIQDVANISGAFQTNLIAWLGSAANGVTNLFAGNIHAQNELCVGSTCVTPAQFQAMVAAVNPSAGPQVSINVGAPPTISGTATPPSINIQGRNPATINVGDTYTDLGAIVTDNQAHDLGYKTFLNCRLVSNIIIDTSAVATDTIDYVATDMWGNTATSTRTVVVEEASSTVN
jgi:hypothetical protein